MSQLEPDVEQYLHDSSESLSFPSEIYSNAQVASAYVASKRAWKRNEYGPAVCEVIDRSISEGCRIRVTIPGSDGNFPVLIFFHGGGWIGGGIESYDRLCREFTNELNAVVVNVGYRLAPEHPFPSAFEDCVASLNWVMGHAQEIRGDLTEVAVAGSSAGGNLAAAIALDSRRREWSLALQVLVYPVIDSRMDTPSYEKFAEGFLLRRDQMAWFWDQYAPSPVDRTDPLLSPAHAKDLTGLPPAVVVTAEFDPLRDEGEEYASHLRSSGVKVSSRRAIGQTHGFLSLLGVIPSAHRAFEDLVEDIRDAWPATRS
jgi:acetyl esterase